jgi:hypothetical protein
MKDIRCTLHWHAWVKKQIEDSQYVVCARCGKDGPHRGVRVVSPV